jgi:uncharacterized protein YjeT (DUF2065 family)
MPAIWVGALLVVSGLLTQAAPRGWRSWLGGNDADPPAPRDGLEAVELGVGFDLEDDLGLALIVMGVILVLAGLCALWDSSSVAGPA